MKLLLAIDDSKFSEAAVQAVAQRLRPEQMSICILHVCEPIYSHIPSYSYVVRAEDIEAPQRQLMKQGKELVARAEIILSKAGFKAETAIAEGDPRVAIVDHAKTWKADLIVLGSHGRKGLDRFAMGSVAEAVAHHASCSVEIVRIPAGLRR